MTCASSSAWLPATKRHAVLLEYATQTVLVFSVRGKDVSDWPHACQLFLGLKLGNEGFPMMWIYYPPTNRGTMCTTTIATFLPWPAQSIFGNGRKSWTQAGMPLSATLTAALVFCSVLSLDSWPRSNLLNVSLSVSLGPSKSDLEMSSEEYLASRTLLMI